MAARVSAVWTVLLLIVVALAAYLGVRLLSADVAGVPTVDLSVSQSGPASAARGGSLDLSLVAVNNGPATARNVVVTYLLPSRLPRTLIFDASRSDPACALQGDTVVCGKGGFLLGKGRTRTFDLAFTVPVDISCGAALESRVSVEARGSTEANEKDNESDALIAMSCPQKADLSLTVDAEESVALEKPFTVTLAVSNAGPDVAKRVFASLSIPTWLVFEPLQSDSSCVASRGSVLCKGGERSTGFDLPSGQSKRFPVVFTISPKTPCGSVIAQEGIVQAVEASDDRYANNTVTNEVLVTCAP